MLKRLYIHNYKCLVNFEFKVDEDEYDRHRALFIGKNGAGKSSISEVLEILHRIGLGNYNLLPVRVEELRREIPPLVSAECFAFGETSQPMKFELDVELAGHLCKYALSLEFPPSFTALRIASEELSVDGHLCFTRQQGDITFTAKQETPFTYDWHGVYLPSYKERDPVYKNSVSAFTIWLKQMLILAPQPRNMEDQLTSNSSFLLQDASNITNWWAGLNVSSPDVYAEVRKQYLLNVFPDFKRLQIRADDFGTQRLHVLFEQDKGKEIMVPFNRLSDGEKCIFLAAFVMMASEINAPVFCFWDEPDNYLAVSEVEFLMTTLKNHFMKKGQIFVTTHNPETLNRFSEDNTYIVCRENHLSHTRNLKTVAQWRKERDFKGDLIEAWILGDIKA